MAILGKPEHHAECPCAECEKKFKMFLASLYDHEDQEVDRDDPDEEE